MIEVDFTTVATEITTESLSQWNKGQTLRVRITQGDLTSDKHHYIHFHNKSRDEAIVRKANWESGTKLWSNYGATIPDSLLKNEDDIYYR